MVVLVGVCVLVLFVVCVSNGRVSEEVMVVLLNCRNW